MVLQVIRRWIELILLFGIIFTFRVPIVGTSSIFLALILFILFFLTYDRSIANLSSIIQNKIVVKIIVSLIGIIIITFLCTILHGAYDFTLIPTLINQLFNFVLIVLYLSIFYTPNRTFYHFIDNLSICFALQGGFIICSLLSPSFKLIMELTQAPGVIERSLLSYGGMRNLGFGLTQFYGLNATLAVGFIVTTFLFIVEKKIKYIIRLSLIFIGIFLSGRTGLIAVFISFIFIVLNNNFNFRKDYKIILYLLPFAILLIFSFKYFINLLPENVMNWALEFYYNYESGDGAGTRSTDTLFNRMYFFPDENIFLLGSGRYTTIDGRYYMETDAGFMRPLLYYGLSGVLFFVFYHFMILKGIKVYLNCFVEKKISVYFFAALGILSIALNVKGEFLGFLIMSQNIIFVLLLSLMLKVKSQYGK